MCVRNRRLVPSDALAPRPTPAGLLKRKDNLRLVLRRSTSNPLEPLLNVHS